MTKVNRKVMMDYTIEIIILMLLYFTAFWFVRDILKHVIIFLVSFCINVTLLSQASIYTQKQDYITKGRFMLALMTNLALAYMAFVTVALFLIHYYWG